MDYGCYFKKGDLDWYNSSHINFLGGCNHSKNFNEAMKMKTIKGISIKIVEGYLVLADNSENRLQYNEILKK